MEGFLENFLNILEEDILLEVYQDNHQFTDCDELWDNISNSTRRLEDDNNNNIINNNGNYSEELIRTSKTYLSNTYYHFHKYLRGNEWFIQRFKEINGVFITLNYHVNNNNNNNNNQMLLNFNEVLDDIKILRRQLITKHYDQLLLNICSPIVPFFTFGGIPFTIFDDGYDDQIHNWRNENLIKIYTRFNGYEEIGLRLMKIMDTIVYKIINCEKPNFQI
ncbi:hypothetical protein ACTFIW_011958 [Dictyostelium discoideum]